MAIITVTGRGVSGESFSVCDVFNDNVKLQDIETMYMYEVPMTLLSNQGHFLSLSYRFPY